MEKRLEAITRLAKNKTIRQKGGAGFGESSP
jgi:hypothetical protein